MNNYHEVKKKLKAEIIEQIDLSREVEDEEINDLIDTLIIRTGKEVHISLAEKNKLRRELFYSIRRLDILQELIDDASVTEIMINGMNGIFIEKDGHLYEWKNQFESKEKLEDVIQQIVAKSNRVINEANPIVDARLQNGARVNVVLAPVALNGPIMTIRRFPENPITIETLIKIGSLTEEVSIFLKKLVISGYNIFISGGTGSGKTTFLNALSGFIPSDERIITIEDSAELQIRGVQNLVRLETRNANIEECKAIAIRDLIKTALRMRPDRIIVGEVRGEEAIDMIQCLNTGHDGSLSTGHANSAKDMLSRLETMILMGMDMPLQAIRRQIASGIDIIIHLGRLRDKTRKVLEIAEIDRYEYEEIIVHSLYTFLEEKEENGKIIGCLQKSGKLLHRQKLSSAGMYME